MTSTSKVKENTKTKQGYKITIANPVDLRVIRSFEISKSRLTWLSVGLGISIMLLTLGLIVFTPLKRMIPGYGKLESNTAYVELTNKIRNLEDQVSSQKAYTEGFRTMLENVDADPDVNISADNALKSNDATIEVVSKLNQKYFSAPLKGIISKQFNATESHYGTDILAPKDQSIVSVLDGVVIQSDYSLKDGYSISIAHDDNIISIYKHNSVLLKDIGDEVTSGEAIAIIGNSGEQTDGPHLHFELWFGGKAIDPEEYINF